jgi:subtilisin family serine protease
VGSSLDEVIEAVGQPLRTVTGQAIKWEDGVLYKDVDGRKGQCYYKPADQNIRFFFADYKVSALYLTADKLADESSFKTVRPIKSVGDFDDVRWKDMSKLDLSGRKGLIATLTFNQETVWPPPDKLPGDHNPQAVLSKAMNPGLGIRNLHRQGITGKGVNVAIIDQAMYLDHPEFSGKIAAYHDLAAGEKSSMHGPAVTSLLSGTNCGTAPDAQVYYAATRSGVYEVDYVDGIDWIIEKNRALPTAEKIRVVSVSAAPGKAGTPSTDNQKKWDQACTRAEAAGILVLDCTTYRGFIGACWYDANNPENVAKCTPGFPGLSMGRYPEGRILMPASPRTTAEEYDKGKFGYQYCGRGGLSWAIPYCAGVLAMGWQINPNLSAEQVRQMLFQSAYVTESGEKIINPKEFINLVRKTMVSPKTGESE